DDELVAHELAVVFAERAPERLEARIRRIRGRAPLPHVAVKLRGRGVVPRRAGRLQKAFVAQIAIDLERRGCELPLRLRRQPRARKTRERVGLVEAHVTNRCLLVDLAPAAERDLALETLGPAQRPLPMELANFRPAVREPQARRAIAARADEFA